MRLHNESSVTVRRAHFVWMWVSIRWAMVIVRCDLGRCGRVLEQRTERVVEAYLAPMPTAFLALSSLP